MESRGEGGRKKHRMRGACAEALRSRMRGACTAALHSRTLPMRRISVLCVLCVLAFSRRPDMAVLSVTGAELCREPAHVSLVKA